MITLYSGLAFYVLATALAFWALRGGDHRILTGARWFAGFAIADHLYYLTKIGVQTGHFPVTGAVEAYIFLSTVVVLIAAVLDWTKKWTSLLVASLPLAVITTLLALALTMIPEGASKETPAKSSIWTGLHVTTALASYGAFAIAFVSSILYLIAQRQLKDHRAASMLGLTPSLETVARVNRRSIGAGVALLAGGLLVGYFQARQVYGIESWWRNDPKIYLTTFTLAAYIVILILSFRPTFKGRRTALASAAGFLLVMATFWASVFWSDFHRFH